MLYDPKWDKESLPAFLAWLETKPADEAYEFLSPRVCACGQYAKDIGVEHWMSRGAVRDFWRDANVLAHGPVGPNGWTFGQLADRVREKV